MALSTFKTKMTKSKYDQVKLENRIIYIDLLRVLATFFVMLIHVSATNYSHLDPTTFEWNILNIYDSLARWVVPMFAMLSGIFFLNINKPLTLKKLYTKSISRVVFALLAWGFIYQIYKGLLGHTIDRYFLIDTVKIIFQGKTQYHLWFLYMIIGLYIITPVLRIFIKSAMKKDIEYFLLFSFIFTSLLPTLNRFEPFNFVAPFFIKFNVSLVLGYTIYFVMGFYLANYNLSRKMKNLFYTLGILGVFVTMIGTRILSLENGSPDTFLYYYLRANVFFTSVAVFLFGKEFLQKIKFSERSLKGISILSSYSFGMYLVHDMIRTILMRFEIDNLLFNQIFSVPIITVIIFIISFIVTYFVRKIPYFGKRIT